MHIVPDLVPADHEARPVAAEHGVGGVVRIPVAVIARGGDDSLRIVAGTVSGGDAGQPPPPPGIGRHLDSVVPHLRHRDGAGDQSHLPQRLRRLAGAPHPLDVRHGPAHLVGGHLQAQVVPGLQQNATGALEPLSHRPVGGLAEIAPLGVLHMGPTGHQRDPHVGDGRAGKHSPVLLLRQVGEDQPLPVPVQLVLGAGGVKAQAAARLPRLQQQMDLGVVAQGLKVAHPLHRLQNSLLIEDAART